MDATLDIYDPYVPNPEVYATRRVKGIEIVPSKGEHLAIVTRPADEWKHEYTVQVIGVVADAGLQKYHIAVGLPEFDVDDSTGVHLEERRFRRLLSASGWTLLAPRRDLPEGIDTDDYEDDELTILHF